MAFLIIIGLLSGITVVRQVRAGGEGREDFSSDRVLVSVKIPSEFMEAGDGRIESRLRNILPEGFTVKKIGKRAALLSGRRSLLSELEESGLEIGEIDTLSGGGRQAGRLCRNADLAFKQNWGPLTYPGEIISDLDVSINNEEDEVAVGTRNSDWSQGKFYYYDYQGNLLQSATFPRGVTEILTNLDIDTSGDEGMCVITRNSGNTEGRVYFYSETGVAMGSWIIISSGIKDVDYRDLDNDGIDEIIVKPKDDNRFYVVSPDGILLWGKTVTDNIVAITTQDLYNNNQYEVIVFSRDTTIRRGQISVFSPTGAPLGSRNYSAADLDGTRSPSYAVYVDLDGDGTEEIIPDPGYLKEKMEILSANCSLLDTENLHRDAWDFASRYDFNGDGNDDIALITIDSLASNTKIHAFIGFNGGGFNSTRAYPAAGTISNSPREWSLDDDRIAFGTQNETTFSNCKVYLINTSDGTNWAGPVNVSGSVDDLKYRDLNDDGNKDVAILANTYSDPTHTWTFYSYDHNLNLLAPSGHFSFQSDTGNQYSSSRFAVVDMNGDNNEELIPTSDRYLGSSAHVVAYTGVLKWSYHAPGPITDLDYYSDFDGDGNDDLGVISAPGGTGHLALLKDNGAAYGTIGSRSFSDEINYVSYRSMDSRPGREIMPRFENSLELSLYSYDLSHCFWSFTPSGDEIKSVNDTNIDEIGTDDLYLASNDTTAPTGYAYVFFGYALPNNPVLASGDYNGDGTSDIAVFRGSTGLWAVRGVTRVYFGGLSDIPVPGDYSGNGAADIGIFRGSSGLWAIRGVTRVYFGSPSDTAVPGDYNGDGRCDPGIFREKLGLWAIQGITRAYFGGSSDAAVPGDYNGDGADDLGIFRGSTGLWALRGISRVYFGGGLDAPVPGDYNGSGSSGIGIFRPASGLWAIRGVTRAYFGDEDDTVIPGDYSGNNSDDIGIFREDSGLWAIRTVTRAYFGTDDDIPVAR